MDESENVVEEVVIADFEMMPLVQENTSESVILTTVIEESCEPELVTVATKVLQERGDVEVVAVEVAAPHSVVKAESPSEVSMEDTPSEDTSEGVPAKPNNIAPGIQGCFEGLAQKKAAFFKNYSFVCKLVEKYKQRNAANEGDAPIGCR